MRFLASNCYRLSLLLFVVTATIFEHKIASNIVMFMTALLTLAAFFTINRKLTEADVARVVRAPTLSKIDGVLCRIWLLATIGLFVAYGWFWCGSAFLIVLAATEIDRKKRYEAALLKPTATIDI